MCKRTVFVFLVLSVTFLFVYENMSGSAERICTKFTGKTYLVPHSDKFEGQRSKSPGTKSGIFRPACGLCLVKRL